MVVVNSCPFSICVVEGLGCWTLYGGGIEVVSSLDTGAGAECFDSSDFWSGNVTVSMVMVILVSTDAHSSGWATIVKFYLETTSFKKR